jgi:cytochrome o ubiquinol oxidase subunit 3
MNNDMITATHTNEIIPEVISEEVRKKESTTYFGFWVYLMTDLVLFASLFSVYAVLRSQLQFGMVGGLSASEVFSAPFVFAETLILLTSSFTCGLAVLAARHGDDAKKAAVIFWLIISGILGAVFVTMEFSEFGGLIASGNDWTRSGFLSSYFALVGTHGLHIIIGLLWVLGLIVSIASRGLTRSNMRKLMLWSMFWHFLDVVWIFIFTIVYLLPLI